MTSGTADQSGSTTSIPEPHKTRIKMINRVLDLAESHDIAANALACNAVPYEFTGDQHKDAADAIQALIDMVGATVARHDPDLHRHITERSEEHTSELQSLMRISYAVFCLKK